MKKIISIILVLAIMLTGIIALVACQNDSLDGKYKRTDGSAFFLEIEKYNIKLYFENELEKNGTFTRSGDKLTTTLDGYENITILDNGDLIVHAKTVGGNDIDITFKKQKN